MAMLLSDILALSGERKLTACVLLLILELFLEGAESVPSSADVEKHLNLGNEFLARGQLADALTHYHEAVEGDPKNYLTLFKRGTVYLALAKSRSAIQDLTRVLELKPDFTSARLQRASVYMKMGEYKLARADYEVVLQQEPYNEAANENYSRIGPAEKQWLIVQDFIRNNDNNNAVPMLTQLLEISPWSIEIRRARAEQYEHQNDYISSISDLRSINKLTQDNTNGFYRVAVLLYRLGRATTSLAEIRECLKLDPEHIDCFPFYKKLRKVEKALTNAETSLSEKRYEECISSAESALKHESVEPMIIFEAKKLLCSCLTRGKENAKAISYCKEALDIVKDDPQILCDRADSYIETEMYDDAIHDYQAALEIDKNLDRAKEGIEKAKRLQKQAEKRDYYKILEVPRSAKKQDIIKAYRKAAQKWHPDNFINNEAEKKIAEKKFIDIAAAKEVLTDPEKRRQFDNGEDPLDPERGQHGGFPGGHNPFAGHFQHGSPFQFKFHFN